MADVTAKVSSVVDTLQKITTGIQLATTVEGVVIPFVIGTIASIRAVITQQGTVEYTVVISSGQGELEGAIQSSTEALTKINAELVKMGKKPLPIP